MGTGRRRPGATCQGREGGKGWEGGREGGDENDWVIVSKGGGRDGRKEGVSV